MSFSATKPPRSRARAVGVLALVMTVGGWLSSPAFAQTAAEKAFVATGDAICQKSNERLAEKALSYERHRLITRRAAKSVNQRVAKPADVAEFVSKVAISEIEMQLNELGSLKPAPSQAVAFSAALKEANRALDDIRTKPDQAAFRNPFQRSSKMFAALGFRNCGQSESRSKSV